MRYTLPFFLANLLAATALGQKFTALAPIVDTSLATGDVLAIVDISANLGAGQSHSITADELSQAFFTNRYMTSESSGTNGHEWITNPSINSIAAGNYNSIIGGGYTSWPQLITGNEDLRFIVGGYDNEVGATKAGCIAVSMHCGVADADGNTNVPGARTVAAGSGHGMVVAASNSFIDTPEYNCIVGGTTNVITSGRGSANVAGEGNTLVGDYMVTVGAKDVIFTGLGERSSAIASASLAGADDCDYTTIASVFNADIDSTDWVFFAADQASDVDGLAYGAVIGNNTVTIAGGLYVAAIGTLDSSINTTGDQHQALIAARDASITTAGNYSIGTGHGATIVNDNQITRGAGYFTASDYGEAQVSEFIVKREITGNTLTELRYSTSPATGSNTSGRITITDDDRTWALTATVVGTETDETDRAMWTVTALIVIDAGVPSIDGQTVTQDHATSNAGTWACDVIVSDSTDSVSIRCAANAAETARFVADVRVVEVGD
jgi:hypothetical protein